jgi:hypothetical protein
MALQIYAKKKFAIHRSWYTDLDLVPNKIFIRTRLILLYEYSDFVELFVVDLNGVDSKWL